MNGLSGLSGLARRMVLIPEVALVERDAVLGEELAVLLLEGNVAVVFALIGEVLLQGGTV